jgi:alpha-methylacyl-CoA racemase
MTDGAAYIGTFLFKFRGVGMWSDDRGTNLLDGGAPFYETYRTKDGKYVAVGAIESQFYDVLLRGLGLDPATMPHQMDKSQWEQTARKFADIFATKTRDEWCAVFDGTDACVAPVLGLGEVADHAHPRARALLVEDEKGNLEPEPAPRLSRTPGRIGGPLPKGGEHTDGVLGELGFGRDEIAGLREAKAIG